MLRLAALAAGIALLVWRVRAIGIDQVLGGFSALGAGGFVLVLGLSLPRFAARAAAWMTLVGDGLSFRRALAATIAGDAAGNLTPLGLLVSEPTKVAYARAEMGAAHSLAALTAENFFYTVSVAIYIVIGAAAMLEAFPVQPALYWMGVAALGGMALILSVAGWMAWQQPSLLSSMLARLPLAPAQRMVERVRAFEVSTYGSAGGHAAKLARVVSFHAVFHLLSFLEMWLTLWYLTGESKPGAALVLDAFGRVANILFRVIPLQLGVHQAGSEMVAEAIGLGGAIGLKTSIVRTARVIVWATVGVALLGGGRRVKGEGVRA